MNVIKRLITKMSLGLFDWVKEEQMTTNDN